MEKTTTLIPRLRTIREAYGWLKNQDPETCLSYNAFRKMEKELEEKIKLGYSLNAKLLFYDFAAECMD